MKQNNYTVLVLAVALLLTINTNAQIITRFAGDSTLGFSGDGGQATAAKMNQPASLVRDAAGNVYIGEGNGCKIRKVNTSGVITTIGGTGTFGWTGDNGPATAAQLNAVMGLAFDVAGNLFFADWSNHVVRKINTSGIITTVAGTGGVSGYSGDGGPATSAKFNIVKDVKFDAAGNLYICDWNNNAIRKINTSGIINTIAGTGTAGYTGDGGPATAAQIHQPYRLAFDASGNLFFVDGSNNSIRKITMSTGIITTVVGSPTGVSGFFGDGGAATAALLASPTALTFDVNGNLYIADRGNGRIRKVNTSGNISTIVGTGASFETGDGGPATAATINRPYDVILDPSNNIFIADINGNTVRKVVAIPIAAFIAPGIVCIDSCITLTSSGIGTLDSLTWSIPGITITNPHSSPINVCFSTTGTYTVTLTAYNISGSNNHTSVVVVNPPPHPFITGGGTSTLSVPAVYTSYQWYMTPAIVITGATTNTYTGASMGLFYVKVDSGGCPGYSDTVAGAPDLVTAINNPENKFWLSQTGNSALTLYATQSLDENLAITIYDITGRRILNDTWSKGSNTKQFNDLSVPTGLYMIKLSNRNTSKVLKWMKQ